jgi:MFS family permease
MSQRQNAVRAAWVACLGIGLLFLARGAFLPYFFPIFENLTKLSYGRIALLLNLYVFSQSVCAPLAGWFTDRTSVRTAVITSIALGSCGFLLMLHTAAFALFTVAMLGIGAGFVLGKIAFNTLLVDSSSQEDLRRNIAGRAVILNVGSFAGNALALQVIESLGHKPLVLLLLAANFTLAIVYLAPRPPVHAAHAPIQIADLAGVLRNRPFIADGLRLFSIYVPYGCWGTIIPKYVIDLYQSEEPVRFIGFVSLCTYLGGSFIIGSWLAPGLYRRGFQGRWWTIVCAVCYCGGLLLLSFAGNRVLLATAIAVFICGEILMTQSFAETAKAHSQASGGKSGMYQGILHVFEGGGRVLGSMTALAVYGWLHGSVLVGYYWVIMVAGFALFCSIFHWWCYRAAKRYGTREAIPPTTTIPGGADANQFEP